jgi:hypothetical protein
MELLFASIPITPINATIVFIVVVPFGFGTAHQCEHSRQHEQWCSTRPRHWRSLLQISSKKASTLYVAPTVPPISQPTVRDRNSISFRQPKSAFQLHHVTHRVVLPIHDERGEPYYMRTATLVVVLGFSICAQGEPVELTAKNFDKKVFSTKSALVKFQAPW